MARSDFNTVPLSIFTAKTPSGAAKRILRQIIADAPQCLTGWIFWMESASAPLRLLAFQKSSTCVESPDISVLQHVIDTGTASCLEVSTGHILLFPLADGSRTAGIAALLCKRKDAFNASSLIMAAGGYIGDMYRRREFPKLEQGKRQWEATFDALEELIFIHDGNGKLLRVNRTFAERLGCSVRYLISHPERIYSLFPISNCRTSERKGVKEAAGSLYAYTCSPIKNEQEGSSGCVHILRDITDHVHFEQRQLQNEKMALLGEALTRVAHELKNPLTSILGYSELIQYSSETEIAREYAEKIAAQTIRTNTLVQELLSFSSPQRYLFAPVRLNTVVEEAIEITELTFMEKGIQMEWRPCKGSPLLQGNREDLIRLVENLLINAVQALEHTPHSRSVRVVTKLRREGGAFLSIKDNGTGMPVEVQQHILEPFFTTRPHGRGTGLGLAIVNNILKAHHASMKVFSSPGKGTRFDILFPLHATDEKKPDLQSTRERISEKRLHVALLEDDLDIRELLQEWLSDMGWRIYGFPSIESLLEERMYVHFDMLISDMNLQGIGGMALYKKIAQTNPDLTDKTIFISGEMQSPEIITFIEQTGSVLLGKPIRRELFLKHVIALASRCSTKINNQAA